jgi:hypothetical protein
LLIAIAVATIAHDVLTAAFTTAMRLCFGYHSDDCFVGLSLFGLIQVYTKSFIFEPLPASLLAMDWSCRT